jgi:hypothetical protein
MPKPAFAMRKVLGGGHSAGKSFEVCGYLMGLTPEAIDISTACWNWHRLDQRPRSQVEP